MEAFEHDVLVIEVRAFLAILHPVPGEGPIRVRRLARCQVGKLLIDPRLQQVEIRANRHVVLVDDPLRRIAIGQHGVEALAHLADGVRNGVGLHAEMQIPIQIPIRIEVGPHQRLACVLAASSLSKNCVTFSPYFGRYKSGVTADM